MKIYTKFGDTGDTALYGGSRISKDTLQIEAIGTVDELNAFIGFANTLIEESDISDILERVQNHLFSLGADLATPDSHTKSHTIRITGDFTEEMERLIDSLSEELPPLTNFILPGGSNAGGLIHLARTVCRRSERCVVRLSKELDINPEIIICLNRLSDLLFVVARVVNNRSNSSEPIWKT
ncbi:cob(I)yrinic acid a,c-diamide adenosyltransferase [Candidatus Poribacteria bacterium]|nr:cob(I)yrinic acid a,c-diamide adenosyltransferase [Candidatus Poribacteria bacterium]